MQPGLSHYLSKLIDTRVSRLVLVITSPSTAYLTEKWGIDVVNLIRMKHNQDVLLPITLETRKDEYDVKITKCPLRFLTPSELHEAFGMKQDTYLATKLKEQPLDETCRNTIGNGTCYDGYVNADHLMSLFTSYLDLPLNPLRYTTDLPVAIVYLTTTMSADLKTELSLHSEVSGVNSLFSHRLNFNNTPIMKIIVHSDSFGEEAAQRLAETKRAAYARNAKYLCLKLDASDGDEYVDIDRHDLIRLMRSYGPYITNDELYPQVLDKIRGKQTSRTMRLLKSDLGIIEKHFQGLNTDIVNTLLIRTSANTLMDSVLKSKLHRVFSGGQKKTEEDAMQLLELMMALNKWDICKLIITKSRIKKSESKLVAELIGIVCLRTIATVETNSEYDKFMERINKYFSLACSIQPTSEYQITIFRSFILRFMGELIKNGFSLPFTHIKPGHKEQNRTIQRTTENPSTHCILKLLELNSTLSPETSMILYEAVGNILHLNHFVAESLYFFYIAGRNYMQHKHTGLALRMFTRLKAIINETGGIFKICNMNQIRSTIGILLSKLNAEESFAILNETIPQSRFNTDLFEQIEVYHTLLSQKCEGKISLDYNVTQPTFDTKSIMIIHSSFNQNQAVQQNVIAVKFMDCPPLPDISDQNRQIVLLKHWKELECLAVPEKSRGTLDAFGILNNGANNIDEILTLNILGAQHLTQANVETLLDILDAYQAGGENYIKNVNEISTVKRQIPVRFEKGTKSKKTPFEAYVDSQRLVHLNESFVNDINTVVIPYFNKMQKPLKLTDLTIIFKNVETNEYVYSDTVNILIHPGTSGLIISKIVFARPGTYKFSHIEYTDFVTELAVRTDESDSKITYIVHESVSNIKFTVQAPMESIPGCVNVFTYDVEIENISDDEIRGLMLSNNADAVLEAYVCNSEDQVISSQFYRDERVLLNFQYDDEILLPPLLSENVMFVDQGGISLKPHEKITLKVTLFEPWRLFMNISNTITFCAKWGTGALAKYALFRIETPTKDTKKRQLNVEISQGKKTPEDILYCFKGLKHLGFGAVERLNIVNMQEYSLLSLKCEDAQEEKLYGEIVLAKEKSNVVSDLLGRIMLKLVRTLMRRSLSRDMLKTVFSGYSFEVNEAIFVATEFKNDEKECLIERKRQYEQDVVLLKEFVNSILKADAFVKAEFADKHAYIPLLRIPTQIMYQYIRAAVVIEDEDMTPLGKDFLKRATAFPVTLKGFLSIRSYCPMSLCVRMRLSHDRKNGDSSPAFWTGLTEQEYTLSPFGEVIVPLELFFVTVGCFDLGSIDLTSSLCIASFAEYCSAEEEATSFECASWMFEHLPQGVKRLLATKGSVREKWNQYSLPEKLVYLTKSE